MSCLMQMLYRDPNRAEAAREWMRTEKAGSRHTARGWTSDTLSYIENLVNLIVAGESANLTEREILRVLAPDGIVVVEKQKQWCTLRTPRSGSIDDWSHFLHGHDNNAGPRKRRQSHTLTGWGGSHKMGTRLEPQELLSEGWSFMVFTIGALGARRCFDSEQQLRCLPARPEPRHSKYTN